MPVNWEKKLNIRTAADHFEKDDSHHSRYEPTPYAVLERLAASGLLQRNDTLVDYGCGRGRVGFFLSHASGCRSIGVEYNPLLVQDARDNLISYAGRNAEKISFLPENAEHYIPNGANRFYFFNPFSVKILHGVIRRIIESYYAAPRPMYLFFYYALDPWIDRLMGEDALEYYGEIDCRDLFHNDDPREKILIFKIAYS